MNKSGFYRLHSLEPSEYGSEKAGLGQILISTFLPKANDPDKNIYEIPHCDLVTAFKRFTNIFD